MFVLIMNKEPVGILSIMDMDYAAALRGRKEGWHGLSHN